MRVLDDAWEWQATPEVAGSLRVSSAYLQKFVIVTNFLSMAVAPRGRSDRNVRLFAKLGTRDSNPHTFLAKSSSIYAQLVRTTCWRRTSLSKCSR